jgi:hypothetical protein
MTLEYYAPSEGIYQHYAWTKNGKVLLCNDSDGEYEQIFGNREELHRFIDHLKVARLGRMISALTLRLVFDFNDTRPFKANARNPGCL